MDLDLNEAKPNECFIKLDKTLSFAWIGPFLSSRANGYFQTNVVFSSYFTRKVFFELLHQKRRYQTMEVLPAIYEKPFDARLLGFLKQTVLPKNLLFLTFGAHFLCLINSMCFFSFLSSLKTEADPLRLWRSYHLSNIASYQIFKSQISPLSELHHPDMHDLIYQKDFLPLSFFSHFLSLQSIICIVLFCFVLFFTFFFFPVLQLLAIFLP